MKVYVCRGLHIICCNIKKKRGTELYRGREAGPIMSINVKIVKSLYQALPTSSFLPKYLTTCTIYYT